MYKRQIQYQPGTYDFYIVDSALDTKIDKIWTPSSSCYGPKEQWVAAAQSENAFKADTLEELAELMEVPADTFVETINHWNEMCAAGADTDFDMPGSMMMTIDQDVYKRQDGHLARLAVAGPPPALHAGCSNPLAHSGLLWVSHFFARPL